MEMVTLDAFGPPVAEEVPSFTAVSDLKGPTVLFQAATPEGRAAGNILVLHLFSTRPEPGMTQKTQAYPDLPTFDINMIQLDTGGAASSSGAGKQPTSLEEAGLAF